MYLNPSLLETRVPRHTTIVLSVSHLRVRQSIIGLYNTPTFHVMLLNPYACPYTTRLGKYWTGYWTGPLHCLITEGTKGPFH